jgi:hypothetical protein
MRIQATQPNKPQPTFGILKGHKKTPYGNYMWGEYKDYRIEIYDAKKYGQKLQYASNSKTLRLIWSKLKYMQEGIKKVIRSNSNGM